MTSDFPIEYYDYKDADLSLHVPSYLRPKKGMRFFAPKSKKTKNGPILHFAVEILNDELVKAHWAIMMRNGPGSTESLGVIQGSVIRRGKTTYIVDGLELLGSSHNILDGNTHHTYNVLLLVGSLRIYATFAGQGEISIFDDMCRTIVSSIQSG